LIIFCKIKTLKRNKGNQKFLFYHLYSSKDKLIELKLKQINYFLEKYSKLPDKIDEDLSLVEGLNETEVVSLNEILKTGFTKWDKKDYDLFVNAIDKYGRNAYETIKNEFENKSIEEIKDYSKAFWEKINDLPDGPKILRNIEKKEKMEKQKENAYKLISKKS